MSVPALPVSPAAQLILGCLRAGRSAPPSTLALALGLDGASAAAGVDELLALGVVRVGADGAPTAVTVADVAALDPVSAEDLLERASLGELLVALQFWSGFRPLTVLGSADRCVLEKEALVRLAADLFSGRPVARI